MSRNKKAFTNVKHNTIHLQFPNGNWISSIWGVGSYTDNHYLGMPPVTLGDPEKISLTPPTSFFESLTKFLDSNEVEVMIDCPKPLLDKIHKKYDGDGSVIGHLNIMQWVEIINLISKKHVTRKNQKNVRVAKRSNKRK